MNNKEKIKFFLKKWKIFIKSILIKIKYWDKLIAIAVKVNIIEKEKSQSAVWEM